MKIFPDWLSDWTREHITRAFLKNYCPDNQKQQVQNLLAEKNWPALDNIMSTYYNRL